MRNWHWFGVPNLGAVLGDRSIGGELAGLGHTEDGHLGPLSVVAVGLVDDLLSSDVAVEVEAGDVVVTTILQVIEDWVDDVGISEETGFDGVEDSL